MFIISIWQISCFFVIYCEWIGKNAKYMDWNQWNWMKQTITCCSNFSLTLLTCISYYFTLSNWFCILLLNFAKMQSFYFDCFYIVKVGGLKLIETKYFTLILLEIVYRRIIFSLGGSQLICFAVFDSLLQV